MESSQKKKLILVCSSMERRGGSQTPFSKILGEVARGSANGKLIWR